jgi:hypothetical protein
VYYKIQRNFGALRSFNPGNPLGESGFIIEAIQQHNRNILGKTFMEVGTGRGLVVPIALWLSGASRIITVDLNPYLKEGVVRKQIAHIRKNRREIRESFGELSKTSDINKRLDLLMSTANNNLGTLLETMNIEYLAPADAASLSKIEDNTVDIHYSTRVLEHIPPNIIRSILLEAKRVLSKEGLLVHRIGLYDHFCDCDKSISSVNFLRFTEKQWDKWAGNRFMYHNRLRAYEFYELFNRVGLEIISKEELIDNKALQYLLESDFPLDDRFVGHSPKQLAVKYLTIVGTFTK